jgi:addiction module RelB/DinJ family antitoxin
MNKYAVINLKTDPELKEQAAQTADRLGISVSAVLNNELRRFVAEQSVTFELPEVPNEETADQLRRVNSEINTGQYHRFESDKDAIDFLRKQTE